MECRLWSGREVLSKSSKSKVKGCAALVGGERGHLSLCAGPTRFGGSETRNPPFLIPISGPHKKSGLKHIVLPAELVLIVIFGSRKSGLLSTILHRFWCLAESTPPPDMVLIGVFGPRKKWT